MDGVDEAALIAAGWTPPGQIIELWTLADLAARYGMTDVNARKARSDGVFPEPDRVIGRSPVWLPATIRAWELDPRRSQRVRVASAS